MILIGYAGHAYVAYGILKASGKTVSGYCDNEEKTINPFGLPFLGTEHSAVALEGLKQQGCFIAIGDNAIRNRIFDQLSLQGIRTFNAIHPSAVIDGSAIIESQAVMIAANVSINPLAIIGSGVICNTGCVIEHECVVGKFSHVGPGAVLCGNVKVGERAFIGANAVVRQGITIGEGVMIGAGAVVVKDVPDGALVTGNPGRVR